MQSGTQPFKQRVQLKLSDLNERYPDHLWTFWASPTMKVYLALQQPAIVLELEEAGRPMDEETMAEAWDIYHVAISECVLDTGESTDLIGQPIDLSTPEKVHAMFESDTVDRELLGGIITDYTNYLTTRYKDHLKKAAARLSGTVGSSGNGQTAIMSPMPS